MPTRKLGEKTLVYSRLGQTAVVTRDWTFNNLIVDCGAYYLKRDMDNGTCKAGTYDSWGRFETLNPISKAQFFREFKRVLTGLSVSHP